MVSLNPLVPKIQIVSGTTQTFDPLAGTFNFNPVHLSLDLNSDSTPSNLTLEIEDSDAADLNSINVGGTITVWLDKKDVNSPQFPAANKVFLGILESKKTPRPRANRLNYDFTAKGFGVRLAYRIVDIQRFQKRLANGIDLDSTDTATELANLVKDMIEDQDVYPANRNLATARHPTVSSDDSITTTNVQTTGFKIPEYIMSFRPITDGLSELAEMAGYNWFIDADKDLHFKPATLASSGITLKDTVAGTDNSTKTGYITEMSWEDNIEQTRNVILGLGGDKLLSIKQQTTDAANNTLDTNYRAVKVDLSGQQNNIQFLDLKVAKIGSPNDLVGEIREDGGGSNGPTGALVKVFNKSRTQITTDVDWRRVDIGAEQINTAVAHWIVLYKVGDASNTYQWQHDNGTSGTQASSADGITWTVTGSSFQYTYRLWYMQKLLTIVEDPTSITNYGRRDVMISWPTVVEDVELEQLSTAQLSISKNKKRIYHIDYLPADTLVPLAKTIIINDTKSGETNVEAYVTNVHYEFDQGIGESNFNASLEATRLLA